METMIRSVISLSLILSTNAVLIRYANVKLMPANEISLSRSVAMNSKYIIIAGASRPGSLLVYTFNGTAVQRKVKLTPKTGEEFKGGVAINENNHLVCGNLVDTGMTGSAYVGRFNGTAWTYQRLVAKDQRRMGGFGYTVDINERDEMVIGPAYIFRKNGTHWYEKQNITVTGLYPSRFGESLSISDSRLLVGAPGAIINNTLAVGMAFIYAKNKLGSWYPVFNVTSPFPARYGSFGISVSIYNETMFIGAKEEDSLKGRVYVYIIENGTLRRDAILQASDGERLHEFGWSVSVYKGTLVVGTGRAGFAYIFKRINGTWQETEKLIGMNDRYEATAKIYNETVAIVQADGLHVFDLSKPSPVPDQKSSSPVRTPCAFSILGYIIFVLFCILL